MIRNLSWAPALLPKLAWHCLLLVPLSGQVTTTTIRGSVCDQSGGLIPNAQVVVTAIETGQSRATQTNGEGQFLVEFLPVGTYKAEGFNTAAFVAPAKGAAGNSGRNIVDAPRFRNVDLGLFRNFPIRESVALQARWEVSNAFNFVSLVIPSTALATTANVSQAVRTSPLFGQIRNAADMRQIQLGLRLTF